jgi:hypothetical protein
MKRCRGCGDLFAFKHHGEWYCQSPDCQAVRLQGKNWRSHQSPSEVKNTGGSKCKRDEVRKNRPWAGVRSAELDAKLALSELRKWMAQERAKW